MNKRSKKTKMTKDVDKDVNAKENLLTKISKPIKKLIIF